MKLKYKVETIPNVLETSLKLLIRTLMS